MDEQLEQIMEQLRRQFGDTGTSLNKFGTGLQRGSKDAESFGKQLKDIGKTVGQDLGRFAKGLGSGETDLKNFNTLVDSAANAAGGLAKSIPILGDAVDATLRAVADASKFVVEQLDATAKSFNTIGSVGAALGDGMTGLRRQFEASGLSLQQYTKVIRDNADTMALFRGLTGRGAEDFSQIVGELTQGSDDSLRKLGLSAENIGTSTAAYVKQQTMLGRAQSATNEQLRQGTVAYVRELDLLSKVTGQSREALQQQQEAALSETRFRAIYEEMLANGQDQSAKALMGFQTVMSSLSKEAGQGVRDLASGVADTDAARKLLISTNGEAANIIQRLKDGQISQAQAQVELSRAFKDNQGVLIEQGRYNREYGETFIGLNDSLKISRAQFDLNGNVIKEAAKEQDKQITATDQLTQDTVSAQKSLEGMAREVNKLTMTVLPDAAKAVNNVTTSMRGLFETIRKAVGGEGGGRPGMGAASAGGAGEFSGSDLGEATGAAMPTGEGPPTLDPTSYIDFTGGTGSKGHFEKLQPGVQQAFLGMARDYNQLTGKKLQVNSAYRSPEEQANVDSGGNPRAAPGMSLHNVGRAVDIQSDQRAFLQSNGLLAQYGFRPLAGDPPHISMDSGGIVSGPISGYKPNMTMHGTEAVVPLPDGRSIPVTPAAQDTAMMQQQLDRLDEMVSLMRNQLSVNTKILQMTS